MKDPSGKLIQALYVVTGCDIYISLFKGIGKLCINMQTLFQVVKAFRVYLNIVWSFLPLYGLLDHLIVAKYRSGFVAESPSNLYHSLPVYLRSISNG